jgi:hypothetical protein
LTPLNNWLHGIGYPYYLQLVEDVGSGYIVVVAPPLNTDGVKKASPFIELTVPDYADLIRITDPFGWMT